MERRRQNKDQIYKTKASNLTNVRTQSYGLLFTERPDSNHDDVIMMSSNLMTATEHPDEEGVS